MADLKKIDVEIENLRRLNKQAYSSRADQYQAEANKTEADLRNLFFTMAFAVIALSSPIFFKSNQSDQELTYLIKVIVTSSLVSLVISVIFGLIDFVTTIKFFERWANNKSEGERIWSMYAFPNLENYEKMGEESKQNLLKSEHTPNWARNLQATFVFLGFILLLAAGLISLWT